MDHQSDGILPHESGNERTVRHRLADLLATTAIPLEELVDNLTLYLRRQPLTDLLSLDALYRMTVDLPGVIMEFGVPRGRHLAALTALRGVHEPYNPHRRIVGFDTFSGFPDVADIDTTSPGALVGRFSVADEYPLHLRDVLDAHEQGEHLAHIRRTLIVQGDVRRTLPRYLADNPHHCRPGLLRPGFVRAYSRRHQRDSTVPDEGQCARLRRIRSCQMTKRNHDTSRGARHRPGHFTHAARTRYSRLPAMGYLRGVNRSFRLDKERFPVGHDKVLQGGGL
jgi:hypothetical protein